MFLVTPVPSLLLRARGLAVPILLAGVVTACGDDASGPDASSAAGVTIEPGSLELGLDQTAVLSVTVTNGRGDVLTGRAVTWSSSDAGVADVSPGGVVTARAPGQATIRAAVDGRTGEAAVVVQPYAIEATALVIDSAALRLLSDAAELAAGVYRFERLAGTGPDLAAGRVIVGAQGGGFLRRVTGVQESGTTVTAQTSPASLVHIVRHGSFEATVNLTSAPGTLRPGLVPAPGQVLWGEAQLVDALDGVTLTAAGLDLSGLDFCQAVSCPSAIKNFKLATGQVAFDPSLTLAATIQNHDVVSFDGIATGDLTLDFDVLLEAQTSTTFNRSATFATVQRLFYAQIGPIPVVGLVQFEVKAAFESKATAKGKIQAGFENRHVVNVGARYREATGWDGVLDGTQVFDAHEPSLSDSTLVGQITLEARVSVTPELRILLYGVAGPFINVEPYGKATLLFGTNSCGIRSVAGIDTKIGFTIPMLDPKVGTFSHTFSPFMWPGRDWDCPLGHLDVTTITNGQDTDADGYRVLVDDRDKGGIGATGSSLVQWIRVGTRSVQLSDVAPNCVVQGANPRNVDVPLGVTTPVDFQVDCSPSVPDIAGTWTLVVNGVCTGPLNVTQNGTDFQVTASLGGGSCPFTASGSGNGQLSGNQIVFGVGFGSGSGGGGGGLGTVDFDGVVMSTTMMSGTFSGSASGTWSASR